jgi:F-type H+-transporting ATPase subunit a
VSVYAFLAVNLPPEPFEAPGLEIFETPCITEIGGFCLNRVVVYMFLVALIVIVPFAMAASRSNLVPRGVQNVVESVIEFIREQIAIQVIGREGLAFVPFLTALFMFIFVGNLFEVIPFIQFPVNSRIAVPMFLAGVSYFLFIIVGIRYQGLGFFKNALFPPGVPKAMYLLLTPIEFVSTFLVRPFTLTVRLLANMIAGHLILTIFFVGAVYLVLSPPLGPVAGVAAFALGTALIAFEILVSILQAYIFTILTAVYLAGAVHPEH